MKWLTKTGKSFLKRNRSIVTQSLKHVVIGKYTVELILDSSKIPVPYISPDQVGQTFFQITLVLFFSSVFVICVWFINQLILEWACSFSPFYCYCKPLKKDTAPGKIGFFQISFKATLTFLCHGNLYASEVSSKTAKAGSHSYQFRFRFSWFLKLKIYCQIVHRCRHFCSIK